MGIRMGWLSAIAVLMGAGGRGRGPNRVAKGRNHKANPAKKRARKLRQAAQRRNRR